MRIAYKIWLDNDGKAFGEGPYRLLKGVERTGSLRQAAMEQGMSYRKAWCTLRDIEEKLGFHILEKKVGGPSGGGSVLTSSGKSLMIRYEQFRAEANEVLEQVYRKHFPA
ncbi:MAG: DNA-binding transcriptional regulator ModE [Syntrophorhabdaceae bacterium PtaU1.Bin034]|nr:MAG: DNA-binding transcriptional regulator ModE [Syntrophorhabdaceae bacterium PtaU1.Bin034]